MGKTTLHFGANCNHYRPLDKRCEVLIQRLQDAKFDYLRVQKWTRVKKASEALQSPLELLEAKVAAGEIKGRRSKERKLTHVFIDQCWGLEVCYLARSGGCCSDFKAHDRPQIQSTSCLIGSDLSQAKQVGEKPKGTLF